MQRPSERRELSACPDVSAQNASRMRVSARSCLLPCLSALCCPAVLGSYVSPAFRCSIRCLTAPSQTLWVARSRGSSTSKPPLWNCRQTARPVRQEKARARMRTVLGKRCVRPCLSDVAQPPGRREDYMSILLCRRRIRRPSSRPSSGMLYGQCLLQVVHIRC